MARIELDLAHSYKANPRQDEDYARRFFEALWRLDFLAATFR